MGEMLGKSSRFERVDRHHLFGIQLLHELHEILFVDVP